MIITSETGINIDISKQVERILHIGLYGDFRSPQSAAFLTSFCKKLTIVAGVHAPGLVVDHVSQHVGRDFAKHLAETWPVIAEETAAL